MRKLVLYRRLIVAVSIGLAAATTACDASEAVAGPADATGTLIVANETSASVLFLYISPCSSSTWGDDRLGSDEVIPPRARRSWNLAPGCYDVRAEFTGDRYAESRLTIQSNVSSSWHLVE